MKFLSFVSMQALMASRECDAEHGPTRVARFGRRLAALLMLAIDEKSRSIRGEVKDIFLPRPEGEDISLPSSPCA